MNNGLVNHTEAEGTVRRGGGAVSGTLFSGSPAPPRQLVVAVAADVVDVAGREQTTLSPAAVQHGAPSPAVRPFSPAAQRAPACWLAEHWLQVHVMKLRASGSRYETAGWLESIPKPTPTRNKTHRASVSAVPGY